jgi:hypothetical protein
MSITIKCWIISKLSKITGFWAAVIFITVLVAIPENTAEPATLILTKAIEWTFSPTFFILEVTGFVICLIACIKVGKFTYRNIDEILSRSARWRTSNVKKFDIRLKYSINRSLDALFIFFATYCFITVIIINILKIEII